MADFKTHVTVSTVLGVGYAGVGYSLYEMPLASCLLAGGLCGVSGMLPDLDSEPGVPLRESVTFAAAVVPMLLIHRFEHMGFTPEMMILVGAGIYLAVRFGVMRLLQWYTVHRGMFHSLPAAAIAAELGFLLCTGADDRIRIFKALAILSGFLSHLVLDEFFSVEWKAGRWHIKRSFGSALKLWGSEFWPNLVTYLKLAALSFLCFYDPSWMRDLATRTYHGHEPGVESSHDDEPRLATRRRTDDDVRPSLLDAWKRELDERLGRRDEDEREQEDRDEQERDEARHGEPRRREPVRDEPRRGAAERRGGDGGFRVNRS
jgi:hypothetical protein